MIDFESLIDKERESFEFDLLKLYSSLDVQSTHTEPRPTQKEAMSELTHRQDEKDLVLKISTGAGKTTVGLLYLIGFMRRDKRPGVYLCPTIQLVDQVLKEAKKLGIQAFHYAGGNPYPDPACMRGEAVVVCTYEKLFNAKNTFSRSDVSLMPVAVVLDDAHAGAEIVRKQFTLQLTGQALEALKEIVGGYCRNYHSTRWADVEGRDASAVFEVPHWIWSDLAPIVTSKLHEYAQDPDFRLVWPFLESNLASCRCVMSFERAEISPEIIPIQQVRPYQQASHRLFMSATLADDSLLVREMNVSPQAALSPITPSSDKGLGERMILAPALVSPELNRSYLMELCGELSRSNNVVVLSSSEAQAREWEGAGASYFAGDDFSEAISRLKNPSSGLRFCVFAQRYDGVDLADDACRVLVIDGVPHGESLLDKNDAQLFLSPGGVRNKTIYRIEQGMGRAVRSHADYAVVLLAGEDLATFIGREEVLRSMTEDTRAQLSLSVELAHLMKQSGSDSRTSLSQVISQCLNRDKGWKNFYNSRIRAGSRTTPSPSEEKVALSNGERKAYELAAANRSQEAIAVFREAINCSGIQGEERGIYLQRLSRIAYFSDQVEAMRIQQAARNDTLTAALPPQVLKKPSAPASRPNAERVCNWFRQFTSLNGAVIESNRLVSSIDFTQKYRRVEQAVMELGSVLGAISSRPEVDFNEGPDVVWFWGNNLYVIEVKSENQLTLHKSDSGQLHDSLKWARDNYPEFADRLVALTVSNVVVSDRGAHYPDRTRILTEASCKELAKAFHQLCVRFAAQGPVFITPENIQVALQEFSLSHDQFLSKYTVPLSE